MLVWMLLARGEKEYIYIQLGCCDSVCMLVSVCVRKCKKSERAIMPS